MNTTPESRTAAALAARARRHLATDRFPDRGPRWFAEVALLEVATVTAWGLDQAYGDDAAAWVTDWLADLPTDDADRLDATHHILTDARFPALRRAIQTQHDLDLYTELTT
jgi:hypothetical protein